LWDRRTQSPTGTYLNFQQLQDLIWKKLEASFNSQTRDDGIPVYKDPILPTKYQAQSGKDGMESAQAEIDAVRKKHYIGIQNGRAPQRDGKPVMFKFAAGGEYQYFFEEVSKYKGIDGKEYFRFDGVTYLRHIDNGVVAYVPVRTKIDFDHNMDWKEFERAVEEDFTTGELLVAGGLAMLIYMISVLASFLVIYSIVVAFKFLMSKREKKAQNSVVVEHTSSGAPTIFQRRPLIQTATTHFQGVAQSDMTTETVINSVASNMFRVWFVPTEEPSSRYKTGGVSFGCRILQIPKHAVNQFSCSDGQKLRLDGQLVIYNKKYGIQTFNMMDPVHAVVFDAANDKCTLYLHGMKQVRTISQHLISDVDMNNSDLSHIIVVGIPDVEPGEDYMLDRRYCSNARVLPNISYRDENSRVYNNKEALGYDMPNFGGMCYYMIFIDNPKIRGKIFGLHAAGNSSRKESLGQFYSKGYDDEIVSFFRSLLGETLIGQSEKETNIYMANTVKPLDDKSTRWKLDPKNFTILGDAGKLYHRLVMDVDMSPTKVQEIVGPITSRPVRLAPHDGIYPIQNSLDDFVSTPEPNDCIISDEDIRDAWQNILGRIKDVVPWRRLTRHEAINGVPSYKHIAALDWSTSGGPNFTSLERTKSKLYKFDYDQRSQGNFTIKENFRFKKESDVRADVIEKLYSLGWEGVSPCELNGKIELRSLLKVNKPRLFSAHETEQNTLGRELFGTFIENLLESRDTMGVTLGINPHNPTEWQGIVKDHLITDPLFQVGDVKHADRDRNVRITRIGNEEIALFLKKKGVLTREEEVVCARGLLNDVSLSLIAIIENLTLLINSCVFSSGCFITAVLQSLYY